jgi:hypothetical protein
MCCTVRCTVAMSGEREGAMGHCRRHTIRRPAPDVCRELSSGGNCAIFAQGIIVSGLMIMVYCFPCRLTHRQIRRQGVLSTSPTCQQARWTAHIAFPAASCCSIIRCCMCRLSLPTNMIGLTFTRLLAARGNTNMIRTILADQDGDQFQAVFQVRLPALMKVDDMQLLVSKNLTAGLASESVVARRRRRRPMLSPLPPKRCRFARSQNINPARINLPACQPLSRCILCRTVDYCTVLDCAASTMFPPVPCSVAPMPN